MVDSKKRKNKKMKTKNCKGIVLLGVIIILLSVGLIGATLATFFITVNISSYRIANEAKALYLAEAGISYAINILRVHAGEEGEIRQTLGPVSLGEGEFTVIIDYPYSLITSMGSVNNVEKKIQLQYAPL
ncbi:MAG: hypothetical protein ABH836_02045 [Candidatus Omnitrophota bacterium]